MTQPAAGFLITALGRRLGEEDRLTELFACVVAGDDELGQALLAKVGLKAHQIVAVDTQVPTGCRLCTTDMRFQLQDVSGRQSSLWSEHKVTSPFGREQLANYRTALAKRRALGETIHFQVILDGTPTVVDRLLLDEMDASILSWGEVADIVEAVQRARAVDWHAAALHPEASGKMRALTEFAVYLEEEVGLAVTGPLDNSKVNALQNIKAARLASDALLDRVADILHPGGERFTDVEGDSDESWLGLSVIGWWNGMAGAMLYLWVAPQRWFSGGAVDPVASFGVAVEVVDAEDKMRLLADGLFTDAREQACLRVGGYPAGGSSTTSTLLVGDSVELSSVADRASLSEQAAELARFAAQVIKQVASCTPSGMDPRGVPVAGELTLALPLDPEQL